MSFVKESTETDARQPHHMQKDHKKCYHCGDECGLHPIVEDQKNFCCDGCVSVFRILNENNLCEFYDYQDSDAVKTRTAFVKGKYLYLDDDKIQRQLLRYRDEDQAVVKFYIPAIHCSACIWLLENLNRIHPDVGNVQVNFPKKEAIIQFKISQLSLKELVELMASIGYEPLISLSSGQKEKKRGNRSLYYRLGVAGFCFGNIMLLSFPEYLGAELYNEDYLRVFPYLNLFLALPVLLYSSTIYLRSAWKGLKSKMLNIDVPIAIGIIVLFGRTAYEILTETGAGYADSLAGLIFFLLIGRWFQQRTYESLSFDRDYAAYFPLGVTQLDNGNEKGIALNDIREGMRLLIRNNDLIPADSILVSGHGRIDYSFVTGESDTQSREPGSLLYAGGRQQGAPIEIVVEKRADQSYLTSLWHQRSEAPVEDGIASVAEHVSRRFTIILLSISAVAAAVWLAIDPSRAAFVVTSILIVACPCALALSVPFAYGTALRVMAAQGAWLRSSIVIEKFRNVRHIIFDKTGTLTVAHNGEPEWNGRELTPEERNALYNTVRSSSHPLSRSIQQAMKNEASAAVTAYNETAGEGIEASINGIHLRVGSASFTSAETPNNTATRVFVQINGLVAGYFMFTRPFRSDLSPAINSLQQSGYQMHVVSGDSHRDEQRIRELFGNNVIARYGCGPDEKEQYVEHLQTQGERVAMIGDGLNDAAAIRRADLGISVAEDAWHFTPASDVIVRANGLHRLPQHFKFAHSVQTIVKWSYVISLTYNLTGIGFALTGNLTPLVAAVLMPLSSITVVAFVAGMTWWKRPR